MAKCPRTSPAPDSSSCSSSSLPTQQQSAVASTCGEVAKMGCSPPVAAVWCDFAVEEGDLSPRDCDNGVRPRPQTRIMRPATTRPHTTVRYTLHFTHPFVCSECTHSVASLKIVRSIGRASQLIPPRASPPAPPLRGPRAVRVFVNPQSVARDGIHPEPVFGALQ